MLVLPLNGAYSASKFGMRAISDALRLELRQCMLPPQLRRRTGEIGIPPEARDRDYDLVVFGSPTWWLTTNMPVRSYLESPVAKKILDGKPFAAASVSRRYWKGNIKGIRTWGSATAARGSARHTSWPPAARSSRCSRGSSSVLRGPRGHFLGIKLPARTSSPATRNRHAPLRTPSWDRVVGAPAAAAVSADAGHELEPSLPDPGAGAGKPVAHPPGLCRSRRGPRQRCSPSSTGTSMTPTGRTRHRRQPLF